MITVAGVPVKDLNNAKQRLIDILSPPERRELARAMLKDVLAALNQAGLNALFVVTRDPEVLELAHRFGATILREAENRGHTEAVALAQRHAARMGADRFLTIPGDVPQVTAEEIRAVCEGADPGPRGVFVPSRSGFGTNAALLTPPDVMPLKFGEPSFANHLTAARERGLEPAVLRLPGLGLDIDGPDDLIALVGGERATESCRLLRAWGFPRRSPHSPSPLSSPPRGERAG
ncbi:MAG: 2-phospho-L-lactate guanylyltransferase [Candidatus Rokubacteria bacterium]|nr:2-phospho-L-lactate guanylyltransferase [Candidatus Rokubacteria bacterium]